MKSRALLPLLVSLLLTGPAAAQERPVTGTVTSATDGTALPGVSVLVKGTTIGTATDAQGRYRLEVPEPESVLVFSFVSFETQEVALDGRTELDAALVETTGLLEDVVVIGYGETSRQRLASSTSSIQARDLQNIPVAGVDAAIQGKTSGVQVIQNSGLPGTGISVRVRGSSSISASNQPLYIVDGVPVISDDVSQLGYGGQDVTAVTGLSPGDIASIDVLKDAAAIAIYGSRGANGVVMITTKRGTFGQPRVTVASYIGSQSVIKPLDLLDASEYVTFMNEAALNDDPTDVDAFGAIGVADSVNTDWQGATFRSAPIRNYDLTLSGGTERLRYYLAGNYFDQMGTVIGSQYNRAHARLNLDLNATDRLFLQTSLALSRESNFRVENDNSIRGVLTNAIANQPNVPIYRADGTFTGVSDGLQYVNGVAVGTLNHGEGLTYRVLGNLTAEYRLLPGLRLNGRAGADVLNLREDQYRSPLIDGGYEESVGGIAKSGYNLGTRYVLEGYGTYQQVVGGRHDLTLTAGASLERNALEWNYINGVGLGDEYFQYVGNASSIEDYAGSLAKNNLVSFFSRGTYIFGDRYILSASLRADGSSRFGPDNKFGIFPAVGLAWRVAEEPGLRSYLGPGRLVSDLKLRGSYGLTGNQEIGNYTWQDVWGSVAYGGPARPGPVPAREPDAELGDHTAGRRRAGPRARRRPRQPRRRLLRQANRRPAPQPPDPALERVPERDRQRREGPQPRIRGPHRDGQRSPGAAARVPLGDLVQHRAQRERGPRALQRPAVQRRPSRDQPR